MKRSGVADLPIYGGSRRNLLSLANDNVRPRKPNDLLADNLDQPDSYAGRRNGSSKRKLK